MDYSKKGGIVVVIILVLVLFVGAFLFFPEGGITGSFIGLGGEVNESAFNAIEKRSWTKNE